MMSRTTCSKLRTVRKVDYRDRSGKPKQEEAVDKQAMIAAARGRSRSSFTFSFHCSRLCAVQRRDIKTESEKDQDSKESQISAWSVLWKLGGESQLRHVKLFTYSGIILGASAPY